MILIGIGHKSRQGKNELGKYLVMEFIKRGYYTKQYAFADALKAHCRIAFGMREKDGKLLQLVGTDIYRKKDEDIWVNALAYQLNDELPDVAIITDMRFDNEADFICTNFGKTINITGRPVDETRNINHVSETELDNYNYDCVITNDRDLYHLRVAAKALVDSMLPFDETKP